jgi:hypothetical protein
MQELNQINLYQEVLMLFSSKKVSYSIALLSAVVLTACGGGGGGTTSSTPAASVVSGSSTGVLTDSAIQGVSYTTSSGVTGITDASGNYKFNPGDTVTFKLGSVSLGTVTANGIISPIDLAAGDANKYRNVLVLVQSLDSDGNPSNGITISAAAAAALPSSLNLAQTAEATFATSIASAVTTSGSGGVVSAANANTHFLSQALALVSSNVYTFIPADNTAGHFGMLRVSSSGEYLQGEVGAAQTPQFQPGVEYGNLSIDIADAYGFHLVSTPIIDTNLTAGVNNGNSPCQRIIPVGTGIYAPNTSQNVLPCNFQPGTPTSLKKAENDPKGIVGVWARGSATTVMTETFVFTSNGNFLTVDPIHPGVESGTYTFNSATNTLTIPTTLPYDTNGPAGLSDGTINSTTRTIVLSSDGMTATVNGANILYRISQ